jgi:hypothetical protein
MASERSLTVIADAMRQTAGILESVAAEFIDVAQALEVEALGRPPRWPWLKRVVVMARLRRMRHHLESFDRRVEHVRQNTRWLAFFILRNNPMPR